MKLNLESPWGRRSTERRKQASPWPLFPHPLTPLQKGQWGDDGDGMKNMPVAGQANQTSSLLARAHGEMKMGGKERLKTYLSTKRGNMSRRHDGNIWGFGMFTWPLLRRFHQRETAAHGAGDLRVRWESAVSSNEQRTLRLANKLTAEYYNKGGDGRRGAAPAFRKHTQTCNSSQLFYLSLEDWLAGIHPLFDVTLSPSIPLILHLCVCYSHTPRSRWHLPRACENITSSLTPTLCLPVLSCFVFFHVCGDKLARQRTVLPMSYPKPAHRSGKTRERRGAGSCKRVPPSPPPPPTLPPAGGVCPLLPRGSRPASTAAVQWATA